MLNPSSYLKGHSQRSLSKYSAFFPPDNTSTRRKRAISQHLESSFQPGTDCLDPLTLALLSSTHLQHLMLPRKIPHLPEDRAIGLILWRKPENPPAQFKNKPVESYFFKSKTSSDIDTLPCASPPVTDTTPGWRKSTSREDSTSTYETDKETNLGESRTSCVCFPISIHLYTYPH
ncbi:hypothetical protein ACFX15_032383 [Malus domestica]